MTPFDGDAAREIVQRELSAGKDDASEEEDLQSLVEKIDRPVADQPGDSVPVLLRDGIQKLARYQGD